MHLRKPRRHQCQINSSYLSIEVPPPTHTRMTRYYNININPNALFFYGVVIRQYTLHTFASTTLITVSTLYRGISQYKNSNHSDRSSKSWLEVACVSTQWLTNRDSPFSGRCHDYLGDVQSDIYIYIYTYFPGNRYSYIGEPSENVCP